MASLPTLDDRLAMYEQSSPGDAITIVRRTLAPSASADEYDPVDHGDDWGVNQGVDVTLLLSNGMVVQYQTRCLPRQRTARDGSGTTLGYLPVMRDAWALRTVGFSSFGPITSGEFMTEAEVLARFPEGGKVRRMRPGMGGSNWAAANRKRYEGLSDADRQKYRNASDAEPHAARYDFGFVDRFEGQRYVAEDGSELLPEWDEKSDLYSDGSQMTEDDYLMEEARGRLSRLLHGEEEDWTEFLETNGDSVLERLEDEFHEAAYYCEESRNDYVTYVRALEAYREASSKARMPEAGGASFSVATLVPHAELSAHFLQWLGLQQRAHPQAKTLRVLGLTYRFSDLEAMRAAFMRLVASRRAGRARMTHFVKKPGFVPVVADVVVSGDGPAMRVVSSLGGSEKVAVPVAEIAKISLVCDVAAVDLEVSRVPDTAEVIPVKRVAEGVASSVPAPLAYPLCVVPEGATGRWNAVVVAIRQPPSRGQVNIVTVALPAKEHTQPQLAFVRRSCPTIIVCGRHTFELKVDYHIPPVGLWASFILGDFVVTADQLRVFEGCLLTPVVSKKPRVAAAVLSLTADPDVSSGYLSSQGTITATDKEDEVSHNATVSYQDGSSGGTCGSVLYVDLPVKVGSGAIRRKLCPYGIHFSSNKRDTNYALRLPSVAPPLCPTML